MLQPQQQEKRVVLNQRFWIANEVTQSSNFKTAVNFKKRFRTVLVLL